MKKIKILGAGISGLTASINLAKHGYQVELFDIAEDVGQRYLGEYQGLENWSSKDDILDYFKSRNIKINFKITPFKKVSWSNGNTTNPTEFEKPIFYLVKRGVMPESIDQGIKKQALELGVNINFKKTIPKDEADIIATGSIKQKEIIRGKGMVFETTSPDIAIGLVSHQAAPNGYSYLLVHNGWGCIYTCVFNKKYINNLSEYFENTISIFHKLHNFNIDNPQIIGGACSYNFHPQFSKGNSILTGEAAGLQDFLFAFGMQNAIASGYLAAQSIINNTNYPSLAHSYFKNKIKAGAVNRFIWEKMSNHSYPYLLNKLWSSKNKFKYMYSVANFNTFQKVLYPITYIYLKKKYPEIF